MLLQWHIKDPAPSAKTADSRLPLNRHLFLTQQSQSELTVLFRHSVGTAQGNEHHSAGQGTLVHSCISSVSHCGLILAEGVELVHANSSALKKKGKQCRQGMICQTFFQDARVQGKHHHHHHVVCFMDSLDILADHKQ